MGFSVSLTLYQIAHPNRAGTGARKFDPDQSPKRPPGPLVWLHAPQIQDRGVVAELVSRISDLYPDLWFLITDEGAVPDTPPDQSFCQSIPSDTLSDATSFLSHWQPDISIWVTDHLLPAFVRTIGKTAIPLFLLDTGSAIDVTHGWQLLPGLRRKTLRNFDTVLSGDEASSLALISAGVHSENVYTTGVLELGTPALPCNQDDWDVLCALTAARPIWLAANVGVQELGSVLAAHTQAMRRAHRLLLIIVPADPENCAEFTDMIRAQNLNFMQRSLGQEPENETQVYLADTTDEMGLWYRLAPVTFIGQTHAGKTGSCPDPFDAAALGSVVLHGPATDPYQVSYDRLARAGASRAVAHLGEIAHAVETLLAPDRAALMAHAAWQISTSGAQAMEKTLDLVSEVLDQTPGHTA